MYDWSGLKFLIAVARRGSTIAAATELGVNQSTVQRRLADLETQLGAKLVERDAKGYHLTDLGHAVLPQAEAVAKAAETFAQSLAHLTRDGQGVIRLTCPEPIALKLNTSGLLDRFHAKHPALRVEFVLSDSYVDLSKGEADIALRSGDTDDNVLVGRKIADSLWAVYASQQYIDRHGKPASIAEISAHKLVGFEATMSKHRAVLWLNEVAPDASYAARNTSVLGLIYATKAGVGIAALPMALGDAEPDLVRVLGPIDALTRPWRILTTPEQRKTPRIEAFFAFILRETVALKPILTG